MPHRGQALAISSRRHPQPQVLVAQVHPGVQFLLQTNVTGTLSAHAEAPAASDEGVTVIVSSSVLRLPLVPVQEYPPLFPTGCTFACKMEVPALGRLYASLLHQGAKTFEQSTNSSLVI